MASSGAVPSLWCRRAKLIRLRRSITSTKDPHMFCLSFCLQGVQLLFSQILQYILRLRKELQLGQVRKTPPCDLSLGRLPGMSREICDLSHERQRAQILGLKGVLSSLVLPLWIWSPDSVRPFPPKITLQVLGCRTKPISPLASPSGRHMSKDGTLDAWW